METIYKKLAKQLDKIPNGYPETTSGVELKILAKLFTPEEAEIACRMNLTPKSAETISQNPQQDKKQVQGLLKSMLKKGLVSVAKQHRELGFKLIPFIVGFYENQNANIDQEFAQLFEDYYQESLYKMMTTGPSVHRVIPIEKNIPVNIEVMPYEKASTYVESSKAWGVLNCICRLQKRLIGEGCHHSVENCLVFSSKENQFKKSDYIRAIDKQEAYKILEQAHEEGLVHSTSNTQDEVTYICNCCTCSCGVMRSIAEHDNLNALAASDFEISIDSDSCSGCGDCIEPCQFDALSLIDDCCQIGVSRCFGCGICISHCPTESLQLKLKVENLKTTPPKNELEWLEVRSKNRGLDFDPDF